MAGFLGLFDYQSSGRGVAKNGPQKNRFFHFFELVGRKFWKLVMLNLLYFAFCIPIITIGPATAGFTKVLRNYTQERNSFMFSDFIETFRKNFKYSFIMGIADVLIFGGIISGLFIYPQLIEQLGPVIYIPFILSISFGIIFLMMNFYIYLMIITTDISLYNIIKNSLYLATIGLKRNIFNLLVIFLLSFLLLIIFFNFAFVILLVPTFLLSFLGFLICYNSYPLIRKYVIDPYYEKTGEENPEKRFDNNPEETLFEDKGGKEAPINMRKVRKGKGKTIS